MGRLLLGLGLLLVLAGLLVLGLEHLGLPWGRLPGDVGEGGGGNVRVWPKGGTLLSLLLYALTRFRR